MKSHLFDDDGELDSLLAFSLSHYLLHSNRHAVGSSDATRVEFFENLAGARIVREF